MRRFALLATALASASLPLAAARADVLGASVDVTGIYGTLTPDNLGTQTITTSGAFYAATPNTGTDILVSPTQISLTDKLTNAPFCTTSATPCGDTFDGFTFQFSGTSAPDITSVTLDPASAADFPPVSVMLSPTTITLNLVGDLPVLGDKLVLDLGFAPVTPPPVTVPEPVSAALLGVGLLGLALARRRAVFRL